MEPSVRNAIARIDVVQQDSVISRGTGFLVAEGLVLTAMHVVADRSQPSLTLYPGDIVLTFPGGQTRAAVHENSWDPSADWALLRCETSPPVRPLPLAELHENQSATWESYGFPDANPYEGMVNVGEVTNCNGTLEGNWVFQLFSREAAAGKGEPVKGFSGSPVIVHGAVVGHLRYALMDDDQTVAGTLYACPIASVLAKTADLLPLPDPCFGLPGLPRRPLPNEPFRNLAWFTEAESEVFFGRNRDIRQIYTRLTDPGAAPVLLLYGQSGVGKSSIVDAGLLPRLRSYQQIAYLRRNAELSLSDTLRTALNLLGGEAAESALNIAAAWRVAERTSGKPLVVFFDQVEEVYTHPNPHFPFELSDFVRDLGAIFAAPAPLGKIALSFRKEWLSEIQKHLEDNHLAYGKIFLEHLDRAGVVEAVGGVTRSTRLKEFYGLTLEAGTAEAIAADLLADEDSPIAPTLQILLTRMWRKAKLDAPSAPAFTFNLYQGMKKEGLALADVLDQQIEAIEKSHPEWVQSGLALDVLTCHTTSLGTGRECPLDDLLAAYKHRAADIPPLLDELQSHFLLSTAARDDNHKATRLAHDTLAPLVRRRFAKSERPGQQARRIIESRVADWTGGSSAGLLDDSALDIVDRGISGMRLLEPKEAAFVEASRAAERKRRTVRRRIIAAGIVAVVAVVTVSTMATIEGIRAIRQKELADERLTASDTLRYLEENLGQAQMLAVAAVARAREKGQLDMQSQHVLFRAMDEGREENRILNRFTGMSQIDWSVDGRTAVVGLDKDAKDAAGHQTIQFGVDISDAAFQPRVRLTLSQQYLRAIAVSKSAILRFSPDGKFLVLGGAPIMVWDNAGKPLPPLQVQAPVKTLAFVPDGSGFLFAAALADGSIQTWDSHWSPKWKVAASDHHTSAVALSATRVEGKPVAVSGAADGTIRLWDLQGRQLPVPIAQSQRGMSVLDGDLSSSNPELAFNVSYDTVRIWSKDSWNDVRFSSQTVCSVRFSPDGKLLAVALLDGTVHFLDRVGTETIPPFKGLMALSCPGMAFSPSGERLAIRSDGGIRNFIVDLKHGAEMQTFDGPATWDGASMEFSPDGNLLAVLGNKDLSVWETRSGMHRGWPHPPGTVHFSRDGNSLFIASGGALEQWTLDGKMLAKVQINGDVLAAAPSADGLRLNIAYSTPPRPDDTNTGTFAVWTPQTNDLTPLHFVGLDPKFELRGGGFSPDGSKIVTECWIEAESRTALQVWNADGTPVSPRFANIQGSLSSLAFSPDSKFIVGIVDSNVAIWTFDGRRLAPPVPSGASAVAGWSYSGLPVLHPDGVTYFRLGPNVGVFDRNSGNLLASFTTRGPAAAIALSPDGTRIAGMENDGKIHIWRASWREWLDVTCTRLRNHPIFDMQLRDGDALGKANARLARDTCQSMVWSKAK